jgi:hypothetical protein
LKAIWEKLRANITTAQEKNVSYYDRNVMTPPDIKVGDLVMIDASNMKTKRPFKKRDHWKIGPVKIVEENSDLSI